MQRPITLREALLSDIDQIVAVERSCVEAPHWTEDVWRVILAEANETACRRGCFVAAIEGDVVGFVVIHGVLDSAEIENVAVQPAARRQGIGGDLCTAAIRWARVRSIEAVDLEVRASSAGGIALYRALGFVLQGRRRDYYRNPVEDALLMRLPLCP